jgi:hypothetical protein
MKQPEELRKSPEEVVEFFKKLKPEDKVKLFMKYICQPAYFYQLIAALGTVMATDPETISGMKIEYQKIFDTVIKESEECYRNHLYFFQKFIEFHEKNFLSGEKGATTR